MDEDAEKLRALRQLHDCGIVGVPFTRIYPALAKLRPAGLVTMRRQQFRGRDWFVYKLTPKGCAVAAAAFPR